MRRQTDRKSDSQLTRPTDTQINGHVVGQTNKPTFRRTYKMIDRQTERKKKQTNR